MWHYMGKIFVPLKVVINVKILKLKHINQQYKLYKNILIKYKHMYLLFAKVHRISHHSWLKWIKNSTVCNVMSRS